MTGVFLWLSSAVAMSSPHLDYDALAARIAGALKLQPGERVQLRPDPARFRGIIEPLERRIRQHQAVAVGAGEPLDGVDVVVLLPPGPAVEAGWLEKGGARRELHFHWFDGTRMPDGLAADHPPEFDRLYQDALDIDYAALSRMQDRVAEVLRRGTVRVETPAGTNVMFRIGRRPFNKQDGDASPERARAARVRVDRHIELPAGVLRVAPIEESVAGNIVIPEARFGGAVARKVVLQIDNGRVMRVRAEQGLEAVEAALAAGGDSARRFREFALGLNPKLAVPPGSPLIPYFGYGAGVVRLSLGDNEELGGAVRGGFTRWFFFPDATVHVDYDYLVRDGSLLLAP
jgi:hypothetical protein